MHTYFDHIIGNDHIKGYLSQMVAKKTIANSLLFTGPDGIGKSLFAEAFAKLLLCEDDLQGIHRHKLERGTHPDVRIYRPEGKSGMHSVDSMRQFSEEVYQPPYEARWKVFILHDADRMLSYGANALLKTFEEPFEQSIIILLSVAPQLLLPTILSRCYTIRFQPIAEQQLAHLVHTRWNKSIEEAHHIAQLARGSTSNAFRLAEQGGDRLRDQVLTLLAKGKVSTYTELLKVASEIGSYVEKEKEQIEEETRASLMKAYPENLTSSQQQAMDKEIEGVIAMCRTKDAHALFDVILSWYRDLNLLMVNGHTDYLLHRDYQEAMDAILQRGDILSIEFVQKAIGRARLALERSTPLNHCLENLFLQLHLVK